MRMESISPLSAARAGRPDLLVSAEVDTFDGDPDSKHRHLERVVFRDRIAVLKASA